MYTFDFLSIEYDIWLYYVFVLVRIIIYFVFFTFNDRLLTASQSDAF